jgi:N-acetylglucosaminyldiphosphoundecaprenol N-acetyl-beta-D-mannosaminyltransferase
MTGRCAAPVRRLFGIPIAALTMTDAVALVARAIQERAPLHIGVVNAAKIVNMHRDAHLRDAVLASDVVLADGMSVVWASRLLGAPLPERVAGIDLMHAILQHGSAHGRRVFCLGAAPDVLATAVRRLEAMYPGVHFVGARDGYFQLNDEEAIAEEIRAARADVLFVAMTSPKKEQFLARWSPVLDVPVCHGVGGSFDVVAGKVHRAPHAWQRLGLEWLYRVKQEPRRLWKRYLVTNLAFVGLVAHELMRGNAQPAR